MNRKKCLAIDHGKVSGFAVMEKDHVICVDSFELSGTDRNEKLLEFGRKVEGLIVKFNPDIIACEKPSDMLNAETARQLIGYYSLVKFFAKVYGAEVEECHVGSVRKCVTGMGNAEKVTVCDALVAKLNIDREMIEEKVMYKSKTKAEYKGKVKHYLYDKSDALALAFYTLYKDEPYVAGRGMYPVK